METPISYTAFDGGKLLFQGSLSEVVLKIKRRLGKADHDSVFIFSDATGRVMDFNFHGGERDVLKRLEVFVSEGVPKDVSGPGRPKLGVISREVSLLPRHWEWLATQSGGASATLRGLIEEAKKKTLNTDSVKQAQERTYRFMSVIAGDLKGYEEALRALYKRDKKNFLIQIQDWPLDVRSHTLVLAQSAFDVA